MRRVSVDEILAGLGSNASAFVPVVDETVVFSNYTERAGQGKMAKIVSSFPSRTAGLSVY
jgi:hypothetical protein